MDTATDEATANLISILELNEDCLTDVFAYLNIAQLLSLSAVCRTFYHVVQPILLRKFHTLDLSDRIQTARSGRHVFKIDSLENMFQKFGSGVKNLSLRRSDFDTSASSKIFSVIFEHCSGLESMQIQDIGFVKRALTSKSAKKAFGQLSSLELINCSFGNDGNSNVRLLFESCQNLSSLKISSGLAELCVALNLSFPKLETFSVNGRCPAVFFDRHPHIKHFHSICFSFEAMAAGCSKLESLSIEGLTHNSSSHIHNLSNLNNLKSLKLHFPIKSFDILKAIAAALRKLAANNKLEVLHLNTENLDENDVLLKSILCCKRLTALYLGNTYVWNDEKLKMLSDSCPDLQRMYFNSFATFTSAGMLEFVSDCVHLTEIHMQYFWNRVSKNHFMEMMKIYRTRCETLEIFTQNSSNLSEMLNIGHTLRFKKFVANIDF